MSPEWMGVGAGGGGHDYHLGTHCEMMFWQGAVIKKNLDTILENIYSQKLPHTLPKENHD
jgi:hypothetical protein